MKLIQPEQIQVYCTFQTSIQVCCNCIEQHQLHKNIEDQDADLDPKWAWGAEKSSSSVTLQHVLQSQEIVSCTRFWPGSGLSHNSLFLISQGLYTTLMTDYEKLVVRQDKPNYINGMVHCPEANTKKEMKHDKVLVLWICFLWLHNHRNTQFL